ncbi:hypothetical protein Hanom_Chr10g00878231 [Helianthus anomalus]
MFDFTSSDNVFNQANAGSLLKSARLIIKSWSNTRGVKISKRVNICHLYHIPVNT